MKKCLFSRVSFFLLWFLSVNASLSLLSAFACEREKKRSLDFCEGIAVVGHDLQRHLVARIKLACLKSRNVGFVAIVRPVTNELRRDDGVAEEQKGSSNVWPGTMVCPGPWRHQPFCYQFGVRFVPHLRCSCTMLSSQLTPTSTTSIIHPNAARCRWSPSARCATLTRCK